ncbi:hypothetical protein DVH24_024663 [Malus domestica]|uniref:K-box domain-containing protein n=1 Tax=Malus domestica TaxID=3750 RepID=A0A498JGK0_MALDO|nr:hypothetical protein DVH24_024663 [Malus domestica]
MTIVFTVGTEALKPRQSTFLGSGFGVTCLGWFLSLLFLLAYRLKHESAIMAKKIEILEASQRKHSGNGLDFCSVEELQEISSQLGRSLCSIRERKAQLYMEQLEQLKAKCGAKPLMEFSAQKERAFAPPELASASVNYRGRSSMSSEEETELFIGPPIMRAVDRIAV